MFLEKSKFCPKCGQELKDGQCPNCGFKIRLSDLFVTKKMFLLSFSLLFFVNSVLSYFCCAKIMDYQIKKTTQEFLTEIGKSIGCDFDSNLGNKNPTSTERDKFAAPTMNVLAEIGNESLAGVPYLNLPEISVPFLKIYIGEHPKPISAMKFYVIFYDVYGEEVKSFWAKNFCSVGRMQGDPKFTFPLLNGVKTVKVFLYSIYYNNGSEWGEHKATRNTILKYGKEITVDGEFE